MSNKNNEINKWKIKDVITTVLLSILLIAIQLIINMICMANHFVSMVLSIGFTMLLCGPVYCLLLHRVRKHFVTLTYMTIIGIIFLLMGNWYLLPFFIFVGIICECILWKDVSLRKAKQVTASWTVASLMYNGINLFPIWFFWDTYYDFALKSGMERSYINSYVHYYTNPKWIIFILIFTTATGFIGSLIGNKLMNKHFKKRGYCNVQMLSVSANKTMGAHMYAHSGFSRKSCSSKLFSHVAVLSTVYCTRKIESIAFLRTILCGAWNFIVRNPLSRVSLGNIFRVLCAHVLESFTDYSYLMGSDHYFSGRIVIISKQNTYAHSYYLRNACDIPFLTYYEIRA